MRTENFVYLRSFRSNHVLTNKLSHSWTLRPDVASRFDMAILSLLSDALLHF